MYTSGWVAFLANLETVYTGHLIFKELSSKKKQLKRHKTIIYYSIKYLCSYDKAYYIKSLLAIVISRYKFVVVFSALFKFSCGVPIFYSRKTSYASTKSG